MFCMKKRVFIVILCLSLVLGTFACGAVDFTNFKMTFSDKNTYEKVTSDTTSVDNPERARLYITSNTSSVRSVFRAGKTSTGSAVTRLYFDRITSGRMMYYTVDIAKDTRIYLQGRPDSSLSNCTITGKFGAG